MQFKKRLVQAVGLTLVAGSLALTSSITLAADPQTADANQPIALAGTLTGALKGSVPGSWSGGRGANNFAYYAFDYAGDNSRVTVNMQVSPDDESVLVNQQVGFVIYGPRTNKDPSYIYAQSGDAPKRMPNETGDFQSMDRGRYLIQVYNDFVGPITYTIWVDGLPVTATPVATAAPAAPTAPVATAAPAPAAAPAATPVATTAPAPVATTAPAPAASPTATSSSSGPVATGDTGDTGAGTLKTGEGDIYQFEYPGDESVYTINVQVSPDDAAILRNAGIQVFDPAGKLLVKGGGQASLKPNVSGNVISKLKGTYVVKVYNDSPNSVINYTIALVTNPPAPK